MSTRLRELTHYYDDLLEKREYALMEEVKTANHKLVEIQELANHRTNQVSDLKTSRPIVKLLT